MLKEVFVLTVFLDKDDRVVWNPPMIMGKVELDHYPSNEEIEGAINEYKGTIASVAKTYRKG